MNIQQGCFVVAVLKEVFGEISVQGQGHADKKRKK
jgi:hypothetical protein